MLSSSQTSSFSPDLSHETLNCPGLGDLSKKKLLGRGWLTLSFSKYLSLQSTYKYDLL